MANDVNAKLQSNGFKLPRPIDLPEPYQITVSWLFLSYDKVYMYSVFESISTCRSFGSSRWKRL